LLEIYRAACRTQRDGRLGDAGRARKVAELDDTIVDLCGPLWSAELPPSDGAENDYRLLINERMRLMLARQLFIFVSAAPVTTPNGDTAPVAGTNNEAERTLRFAAQARKTGRTNKTLWGARRQTILSSVFESIRKQLPAFTLSSVIDEILRWSRQGMSCSRHSWHNSDSQRPANRSWTASFPSQLTDNPFRSAISRGVRETPPTSPHQEPHSLSDGESVRVDWTATRNLVSASRSGYFLSPFSDVETDTWMLHYAHELSS
jgi:hypothetical protein